MIAFLIIMVPMLYLTICGLVIAVALGIRITKTNSACTTAETEVTRG